MLMFSTDHSHGSGASAGSGVRGAIDACAPAGLRHSARGRSERQAIHPEAAQMCAGRGALRPNWQAA